MPATAFSKVDLPEPFGPMTATDAPGGRVALTRSSASSSR